MKQKVAIICIIAPLLFCYIKTIAGSTLNACQLQWSINYACLALLFWSRKNSLLFFASVFNGLMAALCLYVFLPTHIVKYFSFLSQQTFCVFFLLALTFIIQLLFKPKNIAPNLQ